MCRWCASGLRGLVNRGGSLIGALDGAPQEANFLTRTSRRSARFSEARRSFSFGDGLRPGASRMPRRRGAFAEWKVLGELREGVGARRPGMIEGPGTCRWTRLRSRSTRRMEWCHEAPFYTLGPLVIDIAPGTITSPAHRGGDDRRHGRRCWCYVTSEGAPRVPNAEDVNSRRH